MAVIGLDLGGTKLAGAIFEPDGNLINKKVLHLEKRAGNEVGHLIMEMILNQSTYAGSHGMIIESIGCCVPGIAHSANGRVWAPNIPGWDDYPLLEKIRIGINDERINIIIDNDRACSMLGEVWQGTARGCNDAIFLAVGTGIGAGIMINRKILRGSNDVAGAVGWLALNRPYHEKYTGFGCFEYHASGDGLSRITLELLQENHDYLGILKELKSGDLTAHAIFKAYQAHDKIAIMVINQAIAYWGMTVANLVSIFNPEKIIFGGGVFGPAARFLDDIMLEARKWAQPVSIRQVKLEVSSLGGDAGLFGSAFLALTSKTPENKR